MSRIDQALRRAANRLESGEPSAHFGEVFQSAWSLDPQVSSTPPANAAGSPSFESPPIAERRIAARGFAIGWRERLAWGPYSRPELVEQFRRLAATLYQAQTGNGLRTLMVTSAAADDGKTLTAVNLALVLSESYRRRVLLVDADLRCPSMTNVVELDSGVGLSETLRSQGEQKLALVSVTPLLTFLPAGRAVPDPIASLTSPRMHRILQEAAARFDWVILDAPPIAPLADASLLAGMADGILFVVRAGRTQCPIVQKSVEVLGRDRILGVILNDVERMPVDAYPRYDRGEVAAEI